MKIVVVGLGNPILGDDGIGWKVAEEVRRHIPAQGNVVVDVECLSLGGIGLMEHLIGYDKAILVDAFSTSTSAGSISVFDLDQLPSYSAYHITSAHDTSLQNAIQLGRQMGAFLPGNVTVVGISIEPIREFSEDLSPPVEQAASCAVNIVLDLLKEIALIS